MTSTKDIQNIAETIVSSAISTDLSNISVLSSAYVKTQDPSFPTHITFNAPSKSKVSIFCLYEGMMANDKLCSNGLWNFYVLPTSLIDNTHVITYDYLMSLKPTKCSYFGLNDCVGMIGGAET